MTSRINKNLKSVSLWTVRLARYFLRKLLYKTAYNNSKLNKIFEWYEFGYCYKMSKNYRSPKLLH